MPDSEISGQYASILQSLWGRQDGMLDRQVQQRFYQAYYIDRQRDYKFVWLAEHFDWENTRYIRH